VAAPRRQLHLSLFIGIGDEGGFGAWRRSTSRAEELTSLSLYRELAQRAEAAKFDAVFKADSLSLDPDTIASEPTGLEPVSLLSALAAVTSRIGLIGTLSTSFNEPYTIARQLASLDHISGGRAGWNLVTSAWGEENFGGSPLPAQELRYARAAEFLDVTRGLWDSWDDRALLRDRASGAWADPAQIRRIDHVGQFFSVAGPLNLPRPPQGHPVIV
jgi:N-acetyl-S-(2-succino)cysteine monooxygenase